MDEQTPQETETLQHGSTEPSPTDALERLQAELDEWKDLALRRAAEIENIRRRTNAERDNLIRYASEHLLVKLLPIIDDLHNAVEAAQKSSDLPALKEGMMMIYNKTLKVLAEIGVNTIEGNQGTAFDVDLHEALTHVPSSVPEGHIVQQVQRGYQLHDKVLRHAKVVTSAGPSGIEHPENKA